MRGRKPDTIIAGSHPVTKLPAAPKWLSKEAVREWKRAGPILIEERKTLTLADLASFAGYCCAVGEMIEASQIIAKEGMHFMGKTGPRKHPAVSIRNAAYNQVRLFATELGLTPVSRGRPAMREDSNDDDISILDL